MAELTDPLAVGVQLAGVETTLPLLPENDYRVQCTEASVDVNKDKTGHNLNLKLVTTEPVTAVDGREVKVGFPVFGVYALQARDDSKDVEAFKRGLSEVVDALYGTTKDNRPELTRETVNGMVGRTCIAHVIQNEWPQGSGQFNNKVRRLKKDAQA